MSCGAVEIRLLPASEAERLDTERWDALSAAAISPNPFYSAWNLRPALRYLSEGAELELLTAWQNDQLVGLVPLRYRVSRMGLKLATVWKHSECYSGTPLLRSADVWRLMLEGLWQQRGVQMLTNSTQVGVVLSGGNGEHLERLSYARPVLHTRYDYREVQRHWKGKVRRERNRLERRYFCDPSANYNNTVEGIAEQLEDYLSLEAAGWKGRAGTAIDTQPTLRDYYREMARGASQAGAIEIQRLAQGDRPMAMSIRLLSGGRAFEIKTCYDESAASLAPGVVLELQNIRALCRREDIHLADSCTSAGNELLQQLWHGTMPVYSSAYFGPGLTASLMRRGICLYFQLRSLKRRLKAKRPGSSVVFGTQESDNGRV